MYRTYRAVESVRYIYMKETETTLAKTISVAGVNAAYDNACKRILSDKNILAWIMKSCLPEYKTCSVDEIAANYIEGEPQISDIAVHQDEQKNSSRIQGMNTEDASINEGTVTYDIRFYALAPVSGERIRLLINVEAQNDFYPGYPVVKRNIYYCSRLISSQHGTEFEDSHYEQIKKVYSIFICMDPPKYRRNTINCYSIQEKNVIGNAKEKKENYDLMTAVMLCLGVKDDEKASGILRLLEVLLSSDRNAEEKKKILQEEYGIEMTKKLDEEVSEMCNLSKGVEARGIQKGIQKGILSSIQTLMVTMSWTVEQAMDALKIPKEDRIKYLEKL